MTKKQLAAFALGLVLTSSGAAGAAPVVFAVDAGSELVFSLAYQNGFAAGSGTSAVSGEIAVDSTAGTLSISGPNTLSLADIGPGNWTGTPVFLEDGVLTGTGTEIGMGGVGPVGEGNPGEYDLTGWTFTWKQGLFVAGIGDAFSWDMAAFPLAFSIDSALSTLDTSGPLATWTIPMAATYTFTTLAQLVTLSYTGEIHLTEIPEPGTMLLLAGGVIALAARRRDG